VTGACVVTGALVTTIGACVMVAIGAFVVFVAIGAFVVVAIGAFVFSTGAPVVMIDGATTEAFVVTEAATGASVVGAASKGAGCGGETTGATLSTFSSSNLSSKLPSPVTGHGPHLL